jgi:hypothetical protein
VVSSASASIRFNPSHHHKKKIKEIPTRSTRNRIFNPRTDSLVTVLVTVFGVSGNVGDSVGSIKDSAGLTVLVTVLV